MERGRRSFLALAAALALGSANALTQSASQAPASAAAEPSQGSLVQAIRAAEQETGGRARKAEMERDRGIDAYEIKTVSRDRSAKVFVELASGKVLRVEGPGFLGSLFDREDRQQDQAELARLEASRMSLVDAIAAAERESGGRAVEASLKSRYGQTLFEVGVVKDLVLHKVLVDPANGKAIAVPRRTNRDED
jgi:uncharacterized membrane protein YkoI